MVNLPSIETVRRSKYKGNQAMMNDKLKQNKESEDKAEIQLQMLISEAGNEARERKQQAMKYHFKKIDAIVSEAVVHRLTYK